MDSLPVHIAVLTIADDAANADRATSRAISERATSAGHQIVDEEVAADNEEAIRNQLVRWIAEPNIDVVIVAASVESVAASAALAPLVMQTLPGFTDLFRWLTFQEIGASAMQSMAEAAQCESTYVFVLPAHQGAVVAAMDKLILPQLDARTTPKNLVTQMPRLKDAAKRFQAEAKSQPVAAPVKPATITPGTQQDIVTAPYELLPPVDPVIAPHEAIPNMIASEKTEGGSGVMPKMPAKPKTTTNTIARKPDDPPTKQIDLANLEKQIAMSGPGDRTKEVLALTANDAKTKIVDMSAHQAKTRVVDPRRLPRVPPGADELTDDDIEPLTFVSPANNLAQASPVRTSAPIGVVKPPSQNPIATTPVARATPPTGRNARATPPVSNPVIGRPTPGPLKPPANVRATTPPIPMKRSATEPPPVPLGKPPTGPSPAAKASPAPEPAPAAVAPEPPAVEPAAVAPVDPPAAEPPRRPTPVPNAAELWAQSVTSHPASDAAKTSEAPEADAESDASPISALFANQPVRKRPPTPPPVHLETLARQIGGGELPHGDFSYPIKRSGMPLLLKIVLALGLLCAGFFAFVKFYPLTEQPAQTAAATPSEPAPVPAPTSAPAVEVSAPGAELPPPVAEATPPVAEAAGSGSAETASAEPAQSSRHSKHDKPVTKPSGETKPSDGAVTKSTSDPVTEPTETTAAVESKPDPKPSDDGCDEVGCVLAKYDRPCCERYRPKEGFTPKNTVPDELEKSMVKAGIERVKPRVVACGEKSGVKGTVKIAVTVDAQGNVKNASATESPDQALGSCVAGAVKNAKFGKTVNGGEFTYPFVF